MDQKRKKIIGFSIVIILGAAAFFGIARLPERDATPKEDTFPSLSNISATYVTSTNEVVITWSVENVAISAFNTGIRYDTISHSTSSATSESYPWVRFPEKTDTGFEARIPVSDEEEFFYRIQVAYNNEFLWSDEGVVLIDKVSE